MKYLEITCLKKGVNNTSYWEKISLESDWGQCDIILHILNAEENLPASSRKENLTVVNFSIEHCRFCKKSVEEENHTVVETKAQQLNLNQNEINFD